MGPIDLGGAIADQGMDDPIAFTEYTLADHHYCTNLPVSASDRCSKVAQPTAACALEFGGFFGRPLTSKKVQAIEDLYSKDGAVSDLTVDCRGFIVHAEDSAAAMHCNRDCNQDACSDDVGSDTALGLAQTAVRVLDVEGEVIDPMVRTPHAAALCHSKPQDLFSDLHTLATAAQRPTRSRLPSDEQLESVLRRIPLRFVQPL